VVVILAIMATAFKLIADWNFQLGSPYGTAKVIREVTRFVEANQGRWPRNWDEIPSVKAASKYVRMDFDVDENELVSDPALSLANELRIRGRPEIGGIWNYFRLFVGEA
jgi:hypothetical protein